MTKISVETSSDKAQTSKQPPTCVLCLAKSSISLLAPFNFDRFPLNCLQDIVRRSISYQSMSSKEKEKKKKNDKKWLTRMCTLSSPLDRLWSSKTFSKTTHCISMFFTFTFANGFFFFLSFFRCFIVPLVPYGLAVPSKGFTSGEFSFVHVDCVPDCWLCENIFMKISFAGLWEILCCEVS